MESTGKRARLQHRVNKATSTVSKYSADGTTTESSSSLAFALEIPLILERILECLPLPEILHNCSLVNKFWCHESRTFLRDKRICTLSTSLIKPRDINVVRNLSGSKVIPFNRISVNCAEEWERCGNSDTSLSEGLLEEEIFKLIESMTLKYLHIYEDEWRPWRLETPRTSSGGTSIIGRAFRKKQKTIKELSVCWFPRPSEVTSRVSSMDLISYLHCLLIHDYHEELCFPVLRTLKFPRGQSVWPELLDAFVGPILAKAPRLEDVYLSAPFVNFVSSSHSPPVLDMFPKERMHLLKRFQFKFNYYNLEEWKRVFSNEELTCRQLEIEVPKGDGRVPMVLGKLGPFLLRSKQSVTVLVTDFSTMVILKDAGLLDFPRLKFLCLRLEETEAFGADEEEKIFQLSSNFLRTFPHLESVAVEDRRYLIRKYPIELEQAFTFKIPEARRNEHVAQDGRRLKKLTLRDCCNLQGVEETYAALFPHIDHLTVVNSDCQVGKVAYDQIWKHWPTLKSLEFIQYGLGKNVLESGLCGISQAERKLLVGRDPEELKDYVFVPSQPSITHLKNLSQLHVRIVDEEAVRILKEPAGRKRLKCPVPKVTQALAFGRMKNLEVDFEYISEQVKLGRETEMDYY